MRRFLLSAVIAPLGLFLAAICFGGTLPAAEPEKPLEVGDQAPDFELPVQGEDDFVRLSDLIKDGPVAVVVLRGFPGYQCSICNRQVSALISRARALATATGNQPQRIVLIYPGAEEGLETHARQFMGARRLPPPLVLVRDPDMETITEWGLRWDKVRETAYPASYIIGPGRRVKWAKVSDSHAGRASAEEILRGFRNL